MTAQLPIDRMIDIAGGTISREIFVSPAFYREELEKQLSMGRHRINDPVPGDVSTQATEHMARNYYRVYASYLNGGSWDELLGQPQIRVAAE